VLWEALRDRRFAGLKFPRQHTLVGMVLDFFCARAHLAVEVDGAVHDDYDQARSDAARTDLLNELGIRVLRIPNELVLTNLSAALQQILEIISNPAHDLPLCPSKMGEGAGW
jgi:very-short-patch-repair endonuclease